MDLDCPPLEGLRVLIVDDDEDFRAIVAGMLSRNGLDVVTAASADEALAICRQAPPALILMDVWMPGQGGIRACAQFRDAPALGGVPIILMSGQWQSDRHVAKALESGASDILAKERMGVELMARVRSALARADIQVGRPRVAVVPEGLSELLAVCAGCKKVRNDAGDWEPIDSYLQRTTGLDLTHGICPGCRHRVYGAAGRLTPLDPGGGNE